MTSTAQAGSEGAKKMAASTPETNTTPYAAVQPERTNG